MVLSEIGQRPVIYRSPPGAPVYCFVFFVFLPEKREVEKDSFEWRKKKYHVKRARTVVRVRHDMNWTETSRFNDIFFSSWYSPYNYF